MTSAQNLRPLLNGSKIILPFLLLVGVLSCSTTSGYVPPRSTKVLKTDKDRTDDPGTIAKVEIDTVEWTLVSENEVIPITSAMRKESAIEKVMKESYEVALLIPFKTSGLNNIPGLDANKQKFAHFYAGMTHGIKDYGQNSPRIHLTTYDTNRSEEDFRKIMDRMETYKPDLIVGPYETDLLIEAARFAKENRIPLISPWRASTRVTEDNLYYLQLRPNITEYYKRIVEDINYQFDRSEVRIIGRNTGEDNSKIRAFQSINEEQSDLPIVQPYEGLLISEDSLMIADSMVFDKVFEEGARVFILPHFSSRDEGFLYSCLRKIYAEKGDREIYIYAMPLALNSERIDLNIRKNLKIRICEYRFADTRDPKLRKFRQTYFDKFGWLPNEDSYFGNDVMRLITYGLKKYGQYFHYYMAGEKIDLSQMSIFIEPYSKDSNGDVDYMMNSHLYMIEFETDHFEVKNVR